MQEETKEKILKVTEVVKTVVHYGFIPFVIYLGMFFFGRRCIWPLVDVDGSF